MTRVFVMIITITFSSRFECRTLGVCNDRATFPRFTFLCRHQNQHGILFALKLSYNSFANTKCKQMKKKDKHRMHNQRLFVTFVYSGKIWFSIQSLARIFILMRCFINPADPEPFKRFWLTFDFIISSPYVWRNKKSDLTAMTFANIRSSFLFFCCKIISLSFV